MGLILFPLVLFIGNWMAPEAIVVDSNITYLWAGLIFFGFSIVVAGLTILLFVGSRRTKNGIIGLIMLLLYLVVYLGGSIFIGYFVECILSTLTINHIGAYIAIAIVGIFSTTTNFATIFGAIATS